MRWTRALLALCSLLSACGGDDGHPQANASAPSLTYSGRIASVSKDDPAPPCDRFAGQPCAPGRSCQVAARRESGASAFDVYAACVAPQSNARALDAPCAPFGGVAQRLEPGAELYLDPCKPGLLCTNSPSNLGTFQCRPACDLDTSHLCGQGEFCYGGATAVQGACLLTDRCDPTQRSGCSDGVPCYLRPNDTATGLITECIPLTRTDPVPDRMHCESTLDCQPGSWCWGPSDRRPGDWDREEQVCRRTCDAAYDDAEVCDPGKICRELTTAREVLDFSEVPVALGQCENN